MKPIIQLKSPLFCNSVTDLKLRFKLLWVLRFENILAGIYSIEQTLFC